MERETPSVPVGVNLDDPAGKTVGRRRVRDSFVYGMRLLHAAAPLLANPGPPRCRKGVYRFRSFEEADEWMIRMWGAGPNSNPARPSKTT